MSHVVRVESDSSDQSWTVEVTRSFMNYDCSPYAADMPADIRAALAAWLKTAEEAAR